MTRPSICWNYLEGRWNSPRVVGTSVKDEGEDKLPETTIKREAYFVEFAGAVRAVPHAGHGHGRLQNGEWDG
jgi:hypothetical protein